MGRIAIVGEAWGEAEDQWKTPFVGAAGQELTSILADAGIVRKDCFITNVFNFRPEGNDLGTLCCGKKDLPRGYNHPPLIPAGYLRPEFLGEIERLGKELDEFAPTVILALGNTACWALLGDTKIGKIRGTVFPWRSSKVVPTYHPAAILRDWSLRHVTVLDCVKARAESEFPEIRRHTRLIHVAETLIDIELYINRELRPCTTTLSVDIETLSGQITCLGFAPSITSALIIPFFDWRKPGNSYWGSLNEELAAWKYVRYILDLPMPKLGQNGMYDLQYLWIKYGIPVRNYEDDTMLLHHALYPESPKGLGFLGSVYTNEVSWKEMRTRGKDKLKQDD